MNKDLILREKLALQRTVLANQSTYLAFIRTSMYFLIAGLTLHHLLNNWKGIVFGVGLGLVSLVMLILGSINYLSQQRKIKQSEIHIGDYKTTYETTDN